MIHYSTWYDTTMSDGRGPDTGPAFALMCRWSGTIVLTGDIIESASADLALATLPASGGWGTAPFSPLDRSAM